MLINKMVLMLGLLLLVGCASFKAIPPAGFAAYESSKVFRALNPDGVVYRVKVIDEKSGASLDFWKQAIHSRMEEAGYIFQDSSSLSMSGVPAKLLEYATPMGPKDFSYLIVVAQKGEEMFLVESAGEIAEFKQQKAQIIQAVEKTILQ